MHNVCMNPEQVEPVKMEPETVEKPAPVESKESKRGGKRRGAGRKPNLAKRLLKGVSRETIVTACQDIDIAAVIAELLKSKSERTKLEALSFVFDRVLGKPKQDIGVSGGITHVHTRDPFLAQLPRPALEALAKAYDEVLSRFALPPADIAESDAVIQSNQSVSEGSSDESR